MNWSLSGAVEGGELKNESDRFPLYVRTERMSETY